jgi:hypothetical protein
MRLGGHVEFAEQRAAADARRPRSRIHGRTADPGKVDDHPAIACAEPWQAVATTAYGQRQVRVAGKPDGSHNVIRRSWPGDDRRPAIDHAVPDAAGIVVRGVRGQDDIAAEPLSEAVQGAGVEG